MKITAAEVGSQGEGPGERELDLCAMQRTGGGPEPQQTVPSARTHTHTHIQAHILTHSHTWSVQLCIMHEAFCSTQTALMHRNNKTANPLLAADLTLPPLKKEQPQHLVRIQESGPGPKSRSPWSHLSLARAPPARDIMIPVYQMRKPTVN